MPMSNGSKLDPVLEAKLKRLRLCLELADQDTLVLKNVPADHRCFSKVRTNLLIKRSNESMFCLVGVDEDLQYTGTDRALVRAFAAGRTQQGWRVLVFGGCLHGDLSAALEYALGFLGADEQQGNAPAASAPIPGKGLLAAWAENLTDAIASGRAGPTLCRDEEVEQVAACTISWQGRLPLILGEAGTGKTNLLHGAASLLARRGRNVLAVNMGAMMAATLFESEREALLMSLLHEAEDAGAVVALEQAEWAVIGVPRALVLLREALDRGSRLVATSSPEHGRCFGVHPLASRLEIVQLSELCASDTCHVLDALRPSIATHHGVRINAQIEQAVVERSLSMEGLLPGKAVGLLDAAAAHASLTGSVAVNLIDVFLAASRMLGERA
jgi:ATP-dependent Clp protease ATP-binding subunit ClpA